CTTPQDTMLSADCSRAACLRLSRFHIACLEGIPVHGVQLISGACPLNEDRKLTTCQEIIDETHSSVLAHGRVCSLRRCCNEQGQRTVSRNGQMPPGTRQRVACQAMARTSQRDSQED